VLIGINSNIPAALMSNSIQIGGPTATVFLQAADGGLGLVGIAGASAMTPANNQFTAVVVRNGLVERAGPAAEILPTLPADLEVRDYG
uniref:hypothetical protein n=1 Tax=Enterobacter cloacae TaxID=550 RepID=UPI001954AA85